MSLLLLYTPEAPSTPGTPLPPPPAPVGGAPAIECWVTDTAGTWLGTLDRSAASPFRKFTVSRMRGADPGSGSLEYHLDNAMIAANPELLVDANLVFMRYRGRTFTWIIEERKAVVDASEHATDWIRLSGRGVKELLGDRIVYPSAFTETGPGLDPATWPKDGQWRRFVGRPAGLMLWDLIRESNVRFPAKIIEGNISTSGDDAWTQDLRFDNLLDVVASVVAAYGDIDMDGLTFSYAAFPGTDRSDAIIFEESAEGLIVERVTSDRDTITFAVAEGVGEGVAAKLAVADVYDPRRREAYVDAKDAGNLPLVQLRANAAISEFMKADSIALEVLETRYLALIDYDIWDTVRVIAPSRGIDETAVIAALYLAEGDDEIVRVGIDVNTPRQEALLKLASGNRSTARSVGVRNRQPQGQLTFMTIADSVYFDDTTPSITGVYIPDRALLTVECRVAIDFDQYPMAVSALASGGASTSGSSSASSSGSSSNSTSGSQGHTHVIAVAGGSTGGKSLRQFIGISGQVDIATDFGGTWRSDTEGAGNEHAHSIAHDHAIPHTHSTPNHSHSLTAAATKEAYPATHAVNLLVYQLVSGAWTQVGTTISGITDDAPDIDLTAYITGPGRWRVVLQSALGQPHSGRLGAHISGYALVAVQSA